MFFDLNVPSLRTSADREKKEVLGKLFEYGYDCVALNHTIYGRVDKNHRCTLTPVQLDPSPSVCAAGKRCHPSLLRVGGLQLGITSAGGLVGAAGSLGPAQLTRLTVVLESYNDLQAMLPGSQSLLSYDIVAAQPCCQRTFEHLCKEGEADIICLTQASRLPFNVSKRMVDAALHRGIVFEVSFSHAVQSEYVCSPSCWYLLSWDHTSEVLGDASICSLMFVLGAWQCEHVEALPLKICPFDLVELCVMMPCGPLLGKTNGFNLTFSLSLFCMLSTSHKSWRYLPFFSLWFPLCSLGFISCASRRLRC
ncbi:unnamed protein product [Discosporangium mesarthrocarpum]